MKITEKWLNKKSACQAGIDWFKNQDETDGIKIVGKLIEEKQYNWANWLIVRLMKYKQYISYAVFSAKQVLDIFESKYPNDNRPRLAIDAAKKCLKNPSKKNKSAAYAAAYAAADAAAYAAADAANATYTYAAAYAVAAAYAAAYAAADAANATYTYAAAYADAANATEMRIKILNYGLSLLKVKHE